MRSAMSNPPRLPTPADRHTRLEDMWRLIAAARDEAISIRAFLPVRDVPWAYRKNRQAKGVLTHVFRTVWVLERLLHPPLTEEFLAPIAELTTCHNLIVDHYGWRRPLQGQGIDREADNCPANPEGGWHWPRLPAISAQVLDRLDAAATALERVVAECARRCPAPRVPSPRLTVDLAGGKLTLDGKTHNVDSQTALHWV